MTKINENLYIDFGKAAAVGRKDTVAIRCMTTWIAYTGVDHDVAYNGEEAKQVWAAFLRWQGEQNA